jgi:hypothetical protein
MVNVNNNTNPTHAFIELDAVIMPLCSTCGAYFSILKHDFMVYYYKGDPWDPDFQISASRRVFAPLRL